MNQGKTESAVSSKPNKPKTYDEKRDLLTVNTRIYNVAQCLVLAKLNHNQNPIPNENQVLVEFSVLEGSIAIWWYSVLSADTALNSRSDFKNAVICEVLPWNHSKRARNKLCRLKQTRSIARYLAEFRRTILTINEMHEGEEINKFFQALRYHDCIGVQKKKGETLDECTRISLKSNGAMWRGKSGDNQFKDQHSTSTLNHNKTISIEIGNIQHEKLSPSQSEERKKIMKFGPVCSATS